jgi:hypothetical protein
MTTQRPLVFMLVLLAAPVAVSGQGVEIIPFAGRQFGGEIDIRSGRLNIPSAWNYGLVVDIPTGAGTRLEVLYARQQTSLEQVDQATGAVNTLFPMAVQYLQVGVLYEPEILTATRPFGGLTGGLTNYDAQEEERDGVTKFSGGFVGGVKHSLAPHVGVRVDGRILFTFLSSADEIFCAPPDDCLTGVEGAIVAQGLVTAGLMLSF